MVCGECEIFKYAFRYTKHTHEMREKRALKIVSDSDRIDSIFLNLHLLLVFMLFFLRKHLFSYVFGGLLLPCVCVCVCSLMIRNEKEKGQLNSSLYDDKKFHIRPALLWLLNTFSFNVFSPSRKKERN